MTGHEVAFIKGPDAKLYQVGFYIDNWYDILRASNILSRNEVSANGSHSGVTRGETIYFYDPSGNRNEVFTGGYVVYSDIPTITWTEDKLGQGIFYYRRQLNDASTFCIFLNLN